MIKGYLCPVLHAHLPYVRHPEYLDMMEERWLFEAMTETYIPLLDAFENLLRDQIDFRMTMSITPPLMGMLTDPLLQDRYGKHLQLLIELAEKEINRTRWLPEFHQTVLMYFGKFSRASRIFHDQYDGNLLQGFKKFQDLGLLEIVTCCATHGYLPLMENCRPAVRAQVEVACEDYSRLMGRPPRGIWLAECAFNPGDDEILADFGIKFFFADAHGILHGEPRPQYGVFAPLITPSGVAAFGRDIESSRQVWSSSVGYPGDFDYREFYRDIGYDLDFDYIKPYIHESGIRMNTGLKYYRITGGDSDQKEPYNFAVARTRAMTHAGHFVWCRQRQVEYLNSLMGNRIPVIVSPYDAELFGHWWYEGPDFLEAIVREVSANAPELKLVTPYEYLELSPDNQVGMPCLSSWGANGYNEVWLDETNDWIYPHLHHAAERMIELADSYPDADGLLRRALNQAARELLLAQSSDWAFIMKTGTTVPYAHKRTKDHCFRFNRLYNDIRAQDLNEEWLAEVEWRDNLFPAVDYRVFQSHRDPKQRLPGVNSR